MKKQLECILLVDDNTDDNFFHKRVIETMGIAKKIEVVHNGLGALDYLMKEGGVTPELIFLDINMPKMNGWEFLDKYKDLPNNRKSKITIMMLTTSANPYDLKKAKECEDVTGYQTKPLSAEMLNEIVDAYFSDYK